MTCEAARLYFTHLCLIRKSKKLGTTCTYQCWSVLRGDKFELPVPASGDLNGKEMQRKIWLGLQMYKSKEMFLWWVHDFSKVYRFICIRNVDRVTNQCIMKIVIDWHNSKKQRTLYSCLLIRNCTINMKQYNSSLSA